MIVTALLVQVTKFLRIPAKAINIFEKESAINYINTFNNSKINQGASFNYKCIFISIASEISVKPKSHYEVIVIEEIL